MFNNRKKINTFMLYEEGYNATLNMIWSIAMVTGCWLDAKCRIDGMMMLMGESFMTSELQLLQSIALEHNQNAGSPQEVRYEFNIN